MISLVRRFCKSGCPSIDLSSAANLVLEDTVERIYHSDVFAEMHRGLFLIRGENVVLLGEIVRSPLTSLEASIDSESQDLDQEDDVPLRQVEWAVLEEFYKKEVAERKQREEVKAQILFERRGFCKEGGEGDGY